MIQDLVNSKYVHFPYIYVWEYIFLFWQGLYTLSLFALKRFSIDDNIYVTLNYTQIIPKHYA